MTQFIVEAGNNVGETENCKISQSYGSLDLAIDALEEASDHPWHRIVVRDGTFEYEINPKRIKRMHNGEYLPCTKRGKLATDV